MRPFIFLLFLGILGVLIFRSRGACFMACSPGNTAADTNSHEEVADEGRLRLAETDRIDSIVVLKHQRRMTVYHKGKALKVYKIALGKRPVGPKHFEGDRCTPEGLYRINNKNPASTYHKNLGISYPNNADRRYAAAQGKSPGSNVKIHGLPNGQGHIGKGHLQYDWTWGCIAVTDEEIDELYAHVPVGIPILILP